MRFNITYWAVYHKVLNLLDEIIQDTAHVRFKNNVTIYMGEYMYIVTTGSLYITSWINDNIKINDGRKIEFIKDENLKIDEYALTKRSEIIDNIKDLYEN